MAVDNRLVELVDERFAAIKRQHFPSYLDLLKGWTESLKDTEEWIVRKEEEFTQFADTVVAQYQGEPIALHDHTYCAKEEESSFIPHHCSEACWSMGTEVQSPSKYSSLSLPLLLGWRRVFMVRPSEGGRSDVLYVAPCGRRLRSMEEVQQFLDITCSTDVSCSIIITNFTFDPSCSLICPPYNAKAAGAKVFIPDITCEKEAIPITSVNCLTSEPPEHFEYISERVAGPGVHIETDPGFLVSCSCKDNCSNRSKCECWQLTVQEAQTVGHTKHSVGYTHGRLKRPQYSAIYECNSQCSCGPKCGNRVVQKGVEHHLQVFRTEERGWGLRTLRDIPAGSFICTYVGRIFPEHTLEGQGDQTPTPISDEYFAELDYIEVMERHKEGYESEAEFPSDWSSASSDEESYCVDSIHDTKIRLHKVSALQSPPFPVSDDEDDQSSAYTPSNISVISLTSSSVAATPGCSQSPQSHDPLTSPSFSTCTSSTSHILTPTLKPSTLQTDTLPSAEGTPHPASSNRPSHIQTNPLPLANRPSHPRTEHRPTTSPCSHSTSISPHRLQGMRTRHHFSEEYSYIIDAKDKGNIGRYVNHSCSPNMFVQNVFVDTHDLRFPWVAFFARCRIKALQELTWDYSYEVGSVEGKVIYCHCKAFNCRGRLI